MSSPTLAERLNAAGTVTLSCDAGGQGAHAARANLRNIPRPPVAG
jgi:hypothetical protein